MVLVLVVVVVVVLVVVVVVEVVLRYRSSVSTRVCLSSPHSRLRQTPTTVRTL
jgi:hypothetical protein